VIESSGSADLDQTVCIKSSKRASFRPLTDEKGITTTSHYAFKTTWRIPFPYDVRQDRIYVGFLGSDENGRVVVQTVLTGPARTAGLQPGDIVTRINGTPISTFEELTAAAATIQVGRTYSLDIERGGQAVKLLLASEIFPSVGSSEGETIKREMWDAYSPLSR
jgi:predicted metalloprotease with PDZ domain